MAKINKTQHIILGFLQERALSGYELGKMIKASTSHFWQESDASIYPTLELLTKTGKVTVKTEAVGKRNRKIFTITQAGKDAFDAWFTVTPEPSIYRDEFLLKLFFTTTQTQDVMKKHVEKHINELKAHLDTYENIEKMLRDEHSDKPFWMMTLQNGIAYTKAQLAWLQQQKGL